MNAVCCRGLTRTHLINAIRGIYESAPSLDGDPVKAPSLRRTGFLACSVAEHAFLGAPRSNLKLTNYEMASSEKDSLSSKVPVSGSLRDRVHPAYYTKFSFVKNRQGGVESLGSIFYSARLKRALVAMFCSAQLVVVYAFFAGL
jgi:hypothetical protein